MDSLEGLAIRLLINLRSFNVHHSPSPVFRTSVQVIVLNVLLSRAVSCIIPVDWFLAWTTFSTFIDAFALAFAVIGECGGSE